MGEPYLCRTANISPRTCVVVTQMQSNPILRHIYLCRTDNMSWRTCVVVKQIQSNPIQLSWILSWVGVELNTKTATDPRCSKRRTGPLIMSWYETTQLRDTFWFIRSLPRCISRHMIPLMPHICVSELCQYALVHVMVCRLFGAKPLHEPMLTYCQLNPKEQTSVELQSK